MSLSRRPSRSVKTSFQSTRAESSTSSSTTLVSTPTVESNSPLLDVDLAEAKREYDVNVWGPLAVVQAFAPLLIEAKGVISNQSSIDAALSMAWAGKKLLVSMPTRSSPRLGPFAHCYFYLPCTGGGTFLKCMECNRISKVL